jgi:uncharacterized protein YecA (UPF0149 family)
MDTRTGEILLPETYRKALDQMEDTYGKQYLMEMKNDPTPAQLKRRKVGRNEPCPCGSGLKFKKCHLGKPA